MQSPLAQRLGGWQVGQARLLSNAACKSVDVGATRWTC